VYERKTKDCARSWTFQHKSWHLCLLLWCLLRFVISSLYQLCCRSHCDLLMRLPETKWTAKEWTAERAQKHGWERKQKRSMNRLLKIKTYKWRITLGMKSLCRIDSLILIFSRPLLHKRLSKSYLILVLIYTDFLYSRRTKSVTFYCSEIKLCFYLANKWKAMILM